MGLLEELGAEQRRALLLLDSTQDIEGSALCGQADCSWEEMFAMAMAGLIDPGADRVAQQRMHPVLTPLGRQAVAELKAQRAA